MRAEWSRSSWAEACHASNETCMRTARSMVLFGGSLLQGHAVEVWYLWLSCCSHGTKAGLPRRTVAGPCATLA